MNIRGKKISNWYIIGGGLLLVVILAIILFFVLRGLSDGGEIDDLFFGFLFGESTQDSGSGPNSPGVINQDDEPDQTLFRISSEVVGATVSAGGDKVWYFKQASGHLFENTFQGINETRISNVTIPTIQKVQWTPSKEYAIITYYSDGDHLHLYTQYSGTTSIVSAFLPKDIDDITTSHTTNAISYTIRSGGETSIFTSRPNNTNIKNIFSTALADIELAWPSENRISLKTKSSAYVESNLFTLNPATKRFSRIFAEKEGLDMLWSPTGTDMLYMNTQREGTQVSLRVLSIEDDTETVLPFVTLPEKCTWANSSEERVLYCGIPQTISPRTHLPDDWWQGVVSFNDVLWRINVDTGVQQQLLPPQDFDMVHLFLAEDESFLFFTNKKDDSLWSLRLK